MLTRTAADIVGFGLTLAAKGTFPGFAELRRQFEAGLDRADEINRDELVRLTRNAFRTRLRPKDLADVEGDKQAALAKWDSRTEVLWKEWSGHPARFGSLRRAIEEHLIGVFAGLINERRQRALGIDQYVWRSRDDSKVRDQHAENDDKVFDWDTPPEGGHPGQAYNCRCFAEPLVIGEPEYVPDTRPSYILGHAGAEVDGIEEAMADFMGDLASGLAELPGQIAAAARLAVLIAKEARHALTPAEAEELSQMRDRIEARIEEIERLLRNSPEIAAAFLDYVVAVERRPALADEAYRNRLATEAQVQAAFRDRAYLRTLLLLNVAPGALVATLLRRFGRPGDLDDPDGLLQELLEETARTRRHPADVDWELIDNPGIVWGGAIVEQGGPWEGRARSHRRAGSPDAGDVQNVRLL